MDNRFFPNYKGYIVTSPFGMRDHPVDGVYKMHKGIDIVATNDGKTGQVDVICAHTGGTVDAVGYTNTVGNYINIRVSADTVMVYRHLKNPSELKVGAAVKKGDIIGIVGKTGKATARHLHWGIKKDGQWIDPAPYLDSDYPVAPAVKYITLEVPVLKRGMKGEAVRALQAQLVGYGYKIVVDGSFGAKTENAVMCYQEDNGLTPDGSVGRVTRSKMLGLEG